MILQEQKMDVVKSAPFKETEFKIRASAKAFKILSSGLYSCKYTAILRELGCNAYDSHVMAGKKDIPFTVCLPNAFNPTLEISDEGVGLSRDEIENIFTTYFESNKSNSNDLVGCMGLGSKSPFSYTDSFTIVSRYAGEEHTYTAFINENGCPSVAHLNTELTDKCNGLSISFAVEPKDFQQFAEKAKLVYQWFSVPPIIEGVDVQIPERSKADCAVNNWKLRKGSSHHIIMGNVCYPVSTHSAEAAHSLFNHYGIEIDCKIGEVSFTASRESLEYTDRTKAVIKKATSEAVATFSDMVLAELAKCATYWEACLFYNENQLYVPSGTKWNGKGVDYYITWPVGTKYICVKNQYGRRKYTQEDCGAYTCTMKIENNLIFVENDLEKGLKSRTLEWAKNNSGKKLLIFDLRDAAARKVFEDVVGGQLPADKFMKASSLPKVKRAPNSNAGKKIAYEYHPGESRNSYRWKPKEFKTVEATGGLYVELTHWNADGFGKHGLDTYVEKLRALGVTTPVYGVRKNVMKKISKAKQWVSLIDEMQSIQKKYAKDAEFIYNRRDYLAWRTLEKFESRVSGLDISALLKDIKHVVKNQKTFANLYEIMSYRNTFNFTENIATKIEKLEQKYPLFFSVIKNQIQGQDEALVQYLDLTNAGNSDKFQG